MHVSTDIAGEFVETSLAITPAETTSYLDLEVDLSGRSLTLVKNPQNCAETTGTTHCRSTAMLQNDISQFTVVNGSLYIGGLPDVTPYIRSKIESAAGFRGCLGVNNFWQYPVKSFMLTVFENIHD